MLYNFLMKIFIYSPQVEISQIISDHLQEKGNLCFVFQDFSDLTCEVMNQKKQPDLLVLDYLSFNHDLFNIYEFFSNKSIFLPVIFYNDPCLTRSTRTSHWLAQFEALLCKNIAKDFSKYEPLFIYLEELIESNEFRPYITLLQPAKELPQNYIKHRFTLQYLKENSDDCIYTFKERTSIPQNIFSLLKLMQKNKDMLLSIKDIQNLYKEIGKEITEKSIKVMLSTLRKYIREDHDCNFLIYHEKDRYRFIRYKV